MDDGVCLYRALAYDAGDFFSLFLEYVAWTRSCQIKDVAFQGGSESGRTLTFKLSSKAYCHTREEVCSVSKINVAVPACVPLHGMPTAEAFSKQKGRFRSHVLHTSAPKLVPCGLVRRMGETMAAL